MENRRNCWLRGLLISAVILALVQIPQLLSRGLPDALVPYLFSMAVILAFGTLIFGGIEWYYRRRRDKNRCNGN